MMRKPILFHLYFIALFPALSLYAANLNETKLDSVLWAMGASLLLSFSIFMFGTLLLKNHFKAGFLTSIILILFFSYGHIHTMIISWLERFFPAKAILEAGEMNAPGRNDFFVHIALVFLCSAIIATTVSVLFKSKNTFFLATRLLNYVSLILFFLPLVRIGIYQAPQKSKVPDVQKLPVTSRARTEKKRDIYYIILDGYARGDVLLKDYQFDNSDFIDYLRNKGFFVASKSCSNYAWTFLSLASSLNLKYVNYLGPLLGLSSNNIKPVYKMIEDNEVIRFLKSQGYVYVHFSSTWAGTLRNKHADQIINYNKTFLKDEFLRVMAETTALKLFDSAINKELAEIWLYTFKMLEKIPEIEQPTFTFVHIVLPHPPYIFDRLGNIKSHLTLFNQFHKSSWKNNDAYIDQLIFTNNKIKKVIDALLSKSELAPIIIIQSDHGWRRNKDYSHPEAIRARMSNFAAFYLPGQDLSRLSNSMTNVNTFRIVFNQYFNTSYEILKDQSYFSYYFHPYVFSNVTALCN